VPTLFDISTPLNLLRQEGSLERPVSGIAFDSRKIKGGEVFVAVKGTQVDGHDFLESAVAAGAVALVVEEWPGNVSEDVTILQVENSAEALGHMAATFYGNPSKELKVVAVTGTNGKTTTVTLLHDLVSELGYKAGLLSTVENRIGKVVLASRMTTPDAVYLQKHLAEMVEAGCDYVFMEASSHAIVQDRMAGLALTGGVFTNISHDHLDYHKTFKNYIAAKKKLFDDLPKGAFALVNVDDKRGQVMVQNTRAKVKTFGLRSMADIKGKVLENTLLGLEMELDGQAFFGRLIGKFNAYNYLTVYGVAVLLGLKKEEVLRALSRLQAAPGRFETVTVEGASPLGIVDYAHTPDALENVLQTIHSVTGGSGQIITVVGCGGDRDRSKRPKMARIACDYSQRVVLTSDNPRTEDPESILDEMMEGVGPDVRRKVLRISNRREGIRTAVSLTQGQDVVLVAGKGHEKYQEINGVRHDFDDVEQLRSALADIRASIIDNNK
jgi:UDP-N-acetylmuramoyl-L-alanyl-D-glutamate--2,6-diaminopimelate ligase